MLVLNSPSVAKTSCGNDFVAEAERFGVVRWLESFDHWCRNQYQWGHNLLFALFPLKISFSDMMPFIFGQEKETIPKEYHGYLPLIDYIHNYCFDIGSVMYLTIQETRVKVGIDGLCLFLWLMFRVFVCRQTQRRGDQACTARGKGTAFVCVANRLFFLAVQSGKTWTRTARDVQFEKLGRRHVHFYRARGWNLFWLQRGRLCSFWRGCGFQCCCAGSCAVYNCFIDNDEVIGSLGNIEHLRGLVENPKIQKHILNAGWVWELDVRFFGHLVFLTANCIGLRTKRHTRLFRLLRKVFVFLVFLCFLKDFQTKVYRQFFRVVTSKVDVWYPEHNTSNALVQVPPEVEIVQGNKFEMNFL